MALGDEAAARGTRPDRRTPAPQPAAPAKESDKTD